MSRVLYDSTMQRWFIGMDKSDSTTYSFGATTNVKDSGALFYNYYDDPTYLTFKVEFGDWGASVLDRKVLSLGTTAFSVEYADYDLLPMGLLNCPNESDGIDDKAWQRQAGIKSSVFNSTDAYSAFTYLRSRNEDVRAEYIFHFVNGLFELLKDRPYIFKKIAGLDALENVDPTKGRRIEDTTITLECYEGIDLKIKTLMELYRKAAWDDVYLKWILPENMRLFKMIIYIFERRVFQKGDGYGNIVLDDDVNFNLPVKVYECQPCEFELGSYWGNDFDATWENNSETTTMIKIKVKNVKTFYKNGLLKPTLHTYYNQTNGSDIDTKILPLLIYDLIDRLDRTNSIKQYDGDTGASIIGSNTINGIRSLFMNKKVFLSNEAFNDNLLLSSFNTWGKRKVKHNSELLKRIQYLYPTNTNHTNSTSTTYDVMLGADHNNSSRVELSGVIGIPTNSTYSYKNDVISLATDTIISPLYYYEGHLNSEIQQSLYKLLLPRDTVYEDMLKISSRNNGFSTDGTTDGMYTGHNGNVTAGSHISTIDYTEDWWVADDKTLSGGDDASLWSGHVNLELLVMHDPRTVSTEIDASESMLNDSAQHNIQLLSLMNGPIELEKPDLYLINDPRNQVDQRLLNPNNETRVINDELLKMEHTPRQIDDTLKELSPSEKELNDAQLNTLNNSRTIEDTSMNALNDARTLNDVQLYELNEPSQIVESALTYLDPKENKKQEEDLSVLNEPRTITQLEFERLYEPIEKTDDILYTLSQKEREKDNALMYLVKTYRQIPGMEDFTLEDARQLPEDKLNTFVQDYESLMATHKVDKAELLSLINTNNDIDIEPLLRYDEKNKTEEELNLFQLKNNIALMSMINVNSNDPEIIRKLELLSLVKDYAANSEDIKKNFAEMIIGKKDELIELTSKSIEELPLVDMYSLKEPEEKENNEVLISINDVKQLDKNIKLLSLQDTKIRELSTPTLIELNKELDTEILNTKSMIGLTKEVEHRQQEKLIKLTDKNAEKKKDEKKKRKARLGDSANRLKDPKHKKTDKIVY